MSPENNKTKWLRLGKYFPDFIIGKFNENHHIYFITDIEIKQLNYGW